MKGLGRARRHGGLASPATRPRAARACRPREKVGLGAADKGVCGGGGNGSTARARAAEGGGGAASRRQPVIREPSGRLAPSPTRHRRPRFATKPGCRSAGPRAPQRVAKTSLPYRRPPSGRKQAEANSQQGTEACSLLYK
ncbi:unnamed protein product [Nyctereutes procyonoides]|uniref:(raccoon dog) hypothetical protein n=1 Tax=Nyctereutes procyonoides TaxID=34880 RepID=A0A811Y852_NYCPR|nr:unnamed protein product [Nyctereutes procyonoides]